MCGGTAVWAAASQRLRGLSPRVRGNRARVDAPRLQERSIPACAGEPLPPWLSDDDGKVYPRVCGGTGRSDDRAGNEEGLSPRVRGNHPAPRLRVRLVGSIPACAGEPHRVVWRCAAGGVYPRVCGGTCCGRTRRVLSAGLSPRVRGNLVACIPTVGGDRSIPACAGEPSPSRARKRPVSVYPRVCGGTWIARMLTACRRGLSPRVRGNPQDAITA